MKFIRFGSSDQWHLLCFARIRRKKRLHTVCKLKPGAGETYLRTDKVPKNLCNNCCRYASRQQKQKLGIA